MDCVFGGVGKKECQAEQDRRFNDTEINERCFYPLVFDKVTDEAGMVEIMEVFRERIESGELYSFEEDNEVPEKLLKAKEKACKRGRRSR